VGVILDIRLDWFITFILAFIVSFSATPIAKKVAGLIGAIDMPDGDRRVHKKPVARLGGIAIICGFAVAVIFLAMSSSIGESNGFATNLQLLAILTGGAIVAVTGIIDDIRGLRPRIKFILQLIAALSVVLIADMRIEGFTNPITSEFVTLPLYLSYPLTLLWITGITNAINFIDGLDGLAAGITSISCISLFFINIIANRELPAVQAFVAVLTLALAGSAVGFLPFNFFPSKIIMGDTGAYFMGFILAIISIQGAMKSFTAISLSIPVIVLGLPIFDTAASIFRRLNSQHPIAQADRGHLHHRLLALGLTHKQSVIVMYVASAALGLSAIVMADKGTLCAVILLVLVFVFVVGGAFFMKDINQDAPVDKKKTEQPCSIPVEKTDN
jgi:UDP-GlcNAc:undecaprenyl-phosphate GlcNAc-1-phosphate transferase